MCGVGQVGVAIGVGLVVSVGGCRYEEPTRWAPAFDSSRLPVVTRAQIPVQEPVLMRIGERWVTTHNGDYLCARAYPCRAALERIDDAYQLHASSRAIAFDVEPTYEDLRAWAPATQQPLQFAVTTPSRAGLWGVEVPTSFARLSDVDCVVELGPDHQVQLAHHNGALFSLSPRADTVDEELLARRLEEWERGFGIATVGVEFGAQTILHDVMVTVALLDHMGFVVRRVSTGP